jgi:hypothetical protein
VDTPSGKVAKKPNSYDMSIFSFGANSRGAEFVATASGGSSPSIGELWPDIDKLDEIQSEDTSVVHARDISVRDRRSTASIEKVGR